MRKVEGIKVSANEYFRSTLLSVVGAINRTSVALIHTKFKSQNKMISNYTFLGQVTKSFFLVVKNFLL